MVRLLALAKRLEVEQILRTSHHLTNAAIARQTGVSAPTVKILRNALDAEINGEFFVQRLNGVSANTLIEVCKDASYDPAPATTKVRGERELRSVSEHVMKAHTVELARSGCEKIGKKRMREILKKEDSQGFCIVVQDDLYDKAAVDALLKRLEEDKELLALFSSIFEWTQEAPPDATFPQGKKPKTKNDKRAGDGRRLHVRWNVLQEELQKRLDGAEKEVGRLEEQLITAQRKLDAFANADSGNKATRTTKDPIGKNAQRATRALLHRDAVVKALADARKAYEAAEATNEADFKLAKTVRDMLCRIYERLIKHSPYANKVEGDVNDLQLLSIIMTKPKAGSQTMHGDSYQPGGSLLTAARKSQHLIVLLNSYKAMRVLENLLPKRKEALEYVRMRIAAASPDGWIDADWNEQAEIRVWSYLCNLQFAHKRIGTIKAALVPIKEGQTLLVDNRTLHGGSPGDADDKAPLAFRFHAYGYVRAILKRVRQDRYEKDEDVTIDPLDVEAGYYPLCRWAQTESNPPVFRA
jgi:hypothetical protein